MSSLRVSGKALESSLGHFSRTMQRPVFTSRTKFVLQTHPAAGTQLVAASVLDVKHEAWQPASVSEKCSFSPQLTCHLDSLRISSHFASEMHLPVLELLIIPDLQMQP